MHAVRPLVVLPRNLNVSVGVAFCLDLSHASGERASEPADEIALEEGVGGNNGLTVPMRPVGRSAVFATP